MIIYNITISIEESITNDWLNWMKTKHIPEVMACGIFTKAQINRVITHGDSSNTFAIAYNCKNMKDLHQYHFNFSDEIQQKYIARYGEKEVSFRTIMEVIEEF